MFDQLNDASHISILFFIPVFNTHLDKVSQINQISVQLLDFFSFFFYFPARVPSSFWVAWLFPHHLSPCMVAKLANLLSSKHILSLLSLSPILRACYLYSFVSIMFCVNGTKLFVSYYPTVSLRLLASTYYFQSIIPSVGQRDCMEITSLMLTPS